MKKKLSQTNPYLLDRAKRLSGLVISVGSSSAIEGISANVFLKNYLLRKNDQLIPHKAEPNEQ
jgi:hypothetical protein